jgi:hypothetical protein
MCPTGGVESADGLTIVADQEPTMATFQIDPDVPPITSAQSLTGWHRELCIELLGDGAARVFVRAVEESSFKATELQRGILFQRLDPRFGDLAGCVAAMHAELERLVDTARRTPATRDNLFATVTYDRSAWEQVQAAIDRWARRGKR